MVDRTAIKTNQFFVILLSLGAFILNEPVIAFILALIMVSGAFFPRLAVFQQLYHKILKPSGWVKPELVNELSNPHQFASAMGGTIVLIASVLIIYTNFTITGWSLILLVALLALTNFVLGFCMGCFIYFQFSKMRKSFNSKGEL
jgi:hypothetical protein